MKNLSFARVSVFVLCLFGAASCGPGQQGVPSAELPVANDNRALPGALSYRVLHRFSLHEGKGAAFPDRGVMDLNGTLYGTTQGRVDSKLFANGTVYSLSTTGVKRTLFRFDGDDGSTPDMTLLDVNGTLYGTTFSSSKGDGVVFSLTASGVEKVLYEFTGGADGGGPNAGLIDVNGTLYGTTSYGGDMNCNTGGFGGCGTVYSISTSGEEQVLYSFGKGSDARVPYAPLVDVNGTLYGTTLFGGTDDSGTVYSVSLSGSEKVLHSFTWGVGSGDGGEPDGPVLDVNGTLYGVTPYGGQFLFGTVYSLSTSGSEKVVYSFKKSPDAQYPSGGLVNVSGTLYGTTLGGGGEPAGCYYTGYTSYNGCGTLYSVTTAGKEKVLHRFSGGKDGDEPAGDLLDLSGTLYGTTRYGGGGECPQNYGCGTVFALSF